MANANNNMTDQTAECDWASYQEYLTQWHLGEFDPSQRVGQLVEKIASEIGTKFKCRDEIQDLEQDTHLILAQGTYTRGKSLEGFIRIIIKNKAIEWYRKTHQNQTNEWSDDVSQQVDAQVAKDAWEVLKRMLSEEHFRLATAPKFPELQQRILDVIRTHDSRNSKPPSIRKIQQELNRRDPANPVTRYKVTTAYRRLIGSIGRRYISLM